MHASLAALRTSMSNCTSLLEQLGTPPAAARALERSRAQLDELALEAGTGEQFDDGDSVH